VGFKKLPEASQKLHEVFLKLQEQINFRKLTEISGTLL
jgi:hypothetical protein